MEKEERLIFVYGIQGRADVHELLTACQLSEPEYVYEHWSNHLMCQILVNVPASSFIKAPLAQHQPAF